MTTTVSRQHPQPAIPRPAQHLTELIRYVPDIWRVVDMARVQRTWPDWCFLPEQVLTDFLRRYHQRGREYVSDSLEQFRFQGLCAKTTMLGLAAWRTTKGIYRFDPELLQELWETPLEGELPASLLFKLPEWCVYIELPETPLFFDRDPAWDETRFYGFFAYLNYQPPVHTLTFVLDTSLGLFPYPLALQEARLQDCLDAGLMMLREQSRHKDRPEFSLEASRPPEDGVLSREKRIRPMVSLLLYLCSVTAEYRSADGTMIQPHKPRPVQTRKGLRLFPAEKPTLWETGYRIGAMLRAARAHPPEQTGIGTHATPLPHIRRAHWHSFWTGSRADPDARKLVLKWLPPIPVGVTEHDALLPTVRRVE